MTDEPQCEARQPQLQPQAHRRRQRAVGDRHGARRTAQQDRLSEGPMERNLETRGSRAHPTSAPPANEKNVRKKLEAANAIERPKTIWMSRRKPPLVSPKASVSPVTIIMMTAMILATGPWMESRIDCRGASHGMLEPAACAVEDTAVRNARAIAHSRRSRRGVSTEVRTCVTTFLRNGCG